MLETGIGRAGNVAMAAMANFTLPATPQRPTVLHRDITEPFVLSEGRLKVPTGPGLGVKVDLEFLAEITHSSETVKRGAGQLEPQARARPPSGRARQQVGHRFRVGGEAKAGKPEPILDGCQQRVVVVGATAGAGGRVGVDDQGQHVVCSVLSSSQVMSSSPFCCHAEVARSSEPSPPAIGRRRRLGSHGVVA